MTALPVPKTDTGTTHAPRYDDDDVASDTRDLILDTLCRARADAYRRDHRGNADHNAQHGQRGAQLIHLQRAERDAHG